MDADRVQTAVFFFPSIVTKKESVAALLQDSRLKRNLRTRPSFPRTCSAGNKVNRIASSSYSSHASSMKPTSFFVRELKEKNLTPTLQTGRYQQRSGYHLIRIDDIRP